MSNKKSALASQVGGTHYAKHGAYQPWEVLRRWMTPVYGSDEMTENVFNKIRQWGIDRQFLTDATRSGQLKKLIEEVGELSKALMENDHAEIQDAIGDCAVVLTMLAMLSHTSIENCLHVAYEQIKDRKGMMIKGVYVKYKDLSPEQRKQLDDTLSAV